MARTLQYGPVTDYLGEGPEVDVPIFDEETDRFHWEKRRLARCVCVHGKEWSEGDLYEPHGAACQECSAASLKAFRESQA